MKYVSVFAIIFLVIVLAIAYAYSIASSSKEPDFTGYIYEIDQQYNKTIVVGIGGENRDVLIRPGTTRLKVGSKVEVTYKDNEINAIFPSNVAASLREIKVDSEEKRALQTLFTYYKAQYDKNFYPSIISIVDQADSWQIEVYEYHMGMDPNNNGSFQYIIEKEGQTVIKQ